MNYVSTYVFAMLLSASFGVTSLIATAHRFARPPLVGYLAFLVFAFLVATAIHEAAHWLAGVAQGFRSLRFLIGPLEIAPVDSGWRLRLVPFRQAAMVYQVPSSFAHFRFQRATCLSAGPVVSLIFCLLFTRWALNAGSALSFWFWIVNAQMCMVRVLELVPLRFGGVDSDGLRLWQLYRGGAPVDSMQRDLLAESANYTPLRPRDWPGDLVRRLVYPGASRYNRYMAYIHALDCENMAGAWSHLVRILETWRPSDAPQYALEAAYFLAFHRRDPKAGREWLARETRLPEDALRLRAEAAVAWAAGREKAALERIEQAEITLRAGRPSGNRDFEMDCLRAMREEITTGVQPFGTDVRGREPRHEMPFRPRVEDLVDSPTSC